MGDFVGKIIVVGIVVYALYWFVSPYQNCVRGYGEPNDERHEINIHGACTRSTAW